MNGSISRKPKQDERQREHHLLDDGEVLQAQRHGPRLAPIREIASASDRMAGYATLAGLGSRLPSQMK